MSKAGFSLFVFLLYLSALIISISIITPFIYQGYIHLISVVHMVRECNRVENVFHMLERDIQKLSTADGLHLFSNGLSLQHKDHTVTWAVVNNVLYRKTKTQKKMTLQDCIFVTVKNHQRYITMSIKTDNDLYIRNFYTYVGIVI